MRAVDLNPEPRLSLPPNPPGRKYRFVKTLPHPDVSLRIGMQIVRKKVGVIGSEHLKTIPILKMLIP